MDYPFCRLPPCPRASSSPSASSSYWSSCSPCVVDTKLEAANWVATENTRSNKWVSGERNYNSMRRCSSFAPYPPPWFSSLPLTTTTSASTGMDKTVTTPLDLGAGGQQRFVVAYTLKQGAGGGGDKQPDILSAQKGTATTSSTISLKESLLSSPAAIRPDGLLLMNSRNNYNVSYREKVGSACGFELEGDYEHTDTIHWSNCSSNSRVTGNLGKRTAVLICQ